VSKLNKLQHLAWLPAVLNAASYVYTLPVDRIGAGQSAGNLNTYVTLDRNTNVVDDPATVRRGFRESTNQRYYALAWSVETDGAKAVETSFYPAYQATLYRLGSGQVTKRFFVPFEIGYSRAGHFLLERSAPVAGVLRVRSRMLFPAGAVIERTEFKGWKYPAIRLEGEGRAIVWGTTAADSDLLVQYVTELQGFDVTITLADHGPRDITLPVDDDTVDTTEHPEIAAALGL
jgi:hypothetical protein